MQCNAWNKEATPTLIPTHIHIQIQISTRTGLGLLLRLTCKGLRLLLRIGGIRRPPPAALPRRSGDKLRLLFLDLPNDLDLDLDLDLLLPGPCP